MPSDEIPFDQVRTFCAEREVDLVVARPPPQYAFALRGEFDGYGDFFLIAAQDVEYIEVASGVTVGSLLLAPDFKAVARTVEKWVAIADLYSGQCLVIRGAPLEGAESQEHFIVVANRIVCLAGNGWRPSGRVEG